MTYTRFEDTPAWQAAVSAGRGVFALVKDRSFAGQGDLRNQLQRAALSVSNNIAEGFERGSSSGLVYFLYVARGSAGEVRSALQFAAELPEISRLKSQISDLVRQLESVSKQLRGWAYHVRNSGLDGRRYATDAKLADYQQKQRADAFLQQLRDRTPKPPAGPSSDI